MSVFCSALKTSGAVPDVTVNPKMVWVDVATGGSFSLVAIGMKALATAPPGQELSAVGDDLLDAVPYTARQLPDQVRETAASYALGVAASGIRR